MSFLNKPIEQLSQEIISAWEDESLLGHEADVSPFLGRVRFEAGVRYGDEVIIRHDFGMEAMEPTHSDLLSIADSALRTLGLRAAAKLIELQEQEDQRTILFIFSS